MGRGAASGSPAPFPFLAGVRVHLGMIDDVID